MDLSSYSIGNEFLRGRSCWFEALWLLIQALFVNTWIPGSVFRVYLLRLFGAKIGCGVVLRPYLRVKFPWKLVIGNYVWMGEGVWIDNLAMVTVGNSVCISQGAFLCTGNHDWRKTNFDLNTRPIIIEDSAWICSQVKLAPGTMVGQGAIITLGSVASGSVSPWTIYTGVPAVAVKIRKNS